MKYALTSTNGFKSKDYKRVYGATFRSGGKPIGIKYHARFIHNGTRWCSKLFDTEREAALAYDKKCIELGLPPENILKPKPKDNAPTP